jgi:hypothetical protein
MNGDIDSADMLIKLRNGCGWGGNVPFGYINRDKKLVPEEAETIRWIFWRCLELGSIGRLLEEMNRLGMWTMVQTLSNCETRAAGPDYMAMIVSR